MQVKIKVPYGVKVVVLQGMRYEADPYGFIYAHEKDAEMILKDPAYKRDGKRDGLVDTSKADDMGTNISNSVLKKTQEAEKKLEGASEKKA